MTRYQATQPANPVKPRVSNNRGLTQAYDLRDFAAQEALKLKDCEATTLEDKAARALALKNLALVWESASDRIRILRGRPLPGSKRPAPEPLKRKVKSLPLTGSEEP